MSKIFVVCQNRDRSNIFRKNKEVNALGTRSCIQTITSKLVKISNFIAHLSPITSSNQHFSKSCSTSQPIRFYIFKKLGQQHKIIDSACFKIVITILYKKYYIQHFFNYVLQHWDKLGPPFKKIVLLQLQWRQQCIGGMHVAGAPGHNGARARLSVMHNTLGWHRRSGSGEGCYCSCAVSSVSAHGQWWHGERGGGGRGMVTHTGVVRFEESPTDHPQISNNCSYIKKTEVIQLFVLQWIYIDVDVLLFSLCIKI